MPNYSAFRCFRKAVTGTNRLDGSVDPQTALTRWPVLLATVALVSALANVSVGLGYGIPEPGVHDEFAYLLMGDTFAHGRPTNPTHPMWRHFETYHLFHHPTYQAKYPPGQGSFLALGQAVADLPILGVWASLALACAATCWMLGAIAPKPWAFLGGLLLALNPHVMGWWGQSYWGGGVAALGGALLFGAAFRYRQRLLFRDAALMVVGVALLANTRPFEGAIACLTAAPMILLGTRHWLKSDQSANLLRCFAAPFSLGLVVIAAWILYYNYRVTGDAFLVPYLNWHPELSAIESIRTYTGPPRLSLFTELDRLQTFFIAPPLMWLSMLGLSAIVKDARTRFCLLVWVSVIALSVYINDAFPHYVAPFTCLAFAIMIQGLRSIAKLKLGERQVGAIAVSLILVGSLAWDGLYFKQLLQEGPLKGDLPSPRHWDAAFEAPARARETIIDRFEKKQGRDLIIVRYKATGFVDHFEWVYNEADIDAAEVVWARDLGEPANQKLFSYYKRREAWLLDTTSPPLRLRRIKPFSIARVE
jgi:hypothetical protein